MEGKCKGPRTESCQLTCLAEGVEASSFWRNHAANSTLVPLIHPNLAH